MSTFVLLTITGLGLGGVYFLVASGLSLIFGLMDVLNFAHGAFLTVGAYATGGPRRKLDGDRLDRCRGFLLAALVGLAVGARRRRAGRVRPDPPAVPAPHRAGARHRRALARAASRCAGIWGADAQPFLAPAVDCTRRRRSLGARDPERPLRRDRRRRRRARSALVLFLRKTRYGLIIRAGVENRAMVTALGIDVRKAFTLVFAIGGAAAALAGVLARRLLRRRRPAGQPLLIFAFIVVVIGGLGSLAGSAVAAVAVGAVQQFANYYLVRDRRHRRSCCCSARAAGAPARPRGQPSA